MQVSEIYSPFDRPLRELQPDSLTQLLGIPEGWHIEYKSAFDPDLSKHAKFLGGFANGHGGWLFYGVEQVRGTGESKAESFPGVPSESVPECLRKLREANTGRLSPPCSYEVAILRGPVPDAGLPEGRSVICVLVHCSVNPPHVGRDGVVFRRMHDSFVPVADRPTLDRMFDERHANFRRLEQRITTSARHDVEVADAPVIHLFIDPNPYSSDGPDVGLTFKAFAEIVSSREPGAEPTGLTLDNIYRTPGGFVGRLTDGNSYHCPAITWRYYYSGASIVSLSLSTCNLLPNEDVRKELGAFLRSRQGSVDFAVELERTARKRTGPLRIVDLDMVLPVMMAVLYKNWRLNQQASIPEYYCRVRVDNCRYTVPFLGSIHFIDFIRRWRVPIALDETYLVPRTLEEPPFMVSRPDHAVPIQDWFDTSGGFLLLGGLFSAFGLPVDEAHELREALASAAENAMTDR